MQYHNIIAGWWGVGEISGDMEPVYRLGQYVWARGVVSNFGFGVLIVFGHARFCFS